MMLQKLHHLGQAGNFTCETERPSYRFDVNSQFPYNYALVNHISLSSAASSVNLKCDHCELSFPHISLLHQHLKAHNFQSKPSFICNSCGLHFESQNQLKLHNEAVHSSLKNCSACGVQVPSDNKSTKPKCKNCSSAPSKDIGCRNSQMEKPSLQKLGNRAVKLRKVECVTKCVKCNGSGLVFANTSSVLDKRFHCSECDTNFSRYSSLWSHRRLHSGDKPFKCDYCGTTFARAAYLKNHSRVHSGERPFKCSICGQQFSQAPHLKNHERIHSGERPYHCEVCSKKFARHSTLWNHRRIHTGEKPYRCETCGSTFNQATHLKNHAKVHTGEKPHQCEICSVRFSDRFALKRHLTTHEKYGQTSRSDIDDLYKCSMVKPDLSRTADDSYSKPVCTESDTIYRCELVEGFAFPGCSRPPEHN